MRKELMLARADKLSQENEYETFLQKQAGEQEERRAKLRESENKAWDWSPDEFDAISSALEVQDKIPAPVIEAAARRVLNPELPLRKWNFAVRVLERGNASLDELYTITSVSPHS